MYFRGKLNYPENLANFDCPTKLSANTKKKFRWREIGQRRYGAEKEFNKARSILFTGQSRDFPIHSWLLLVLAQLDIDSTPQL